MKLVDGYIELTRELLALVEGEEATITWVNPAWQGALGLEPDALIGRSFLDLIAPDLAATAREALSRARAAPAPLRDVRMAVRLPGGALRWVSWSMAPESDPGGGPGAARLVVVGHDIDAEVQLAAQRDALERERRLFIGGPVVVFRWVAAEGWPVEYVSPNVAQQFGVTDEDLVSGRVPYASIVHPEDLARVGAEVAQYTAAGVKTFEQDYRLVRPGGEVRWIYDFTVVNRDGAGAVTHYEGYIVDITERKRAEEELRRQVELVEQQRAAIRSLSTPVIHVWDGVIALPVVGYVDTRRAADMMGALLDGIVELQARCAILDLTGVEVIDTETTGHLMRMVSAAGLLGAECIVCGISPAIAQTMIAMDAERFTVKALPRLRDALAYAIRAAQR